MRADLLGLFILESTVLKCDSYQTHTAIKENFSQLLLFKASMWLFKEKRTDHNALIKTTNELHYAIQFPFNSWLQTQFVLNIEHFFS